MQCVCCHNVDSCRPGTTPDNQDLANHLTSQTRLRYFIILFESSLQNARKYCEEVDNYQDIPLPQIWRRRGAGETEGLGYQGRDGQHWQLLLALQLAGGGVLGVLGQHLVDLPDLSGVETVLLQELLQSLSDLQ